MQSKRVAIIGPESTGKSTLCEQLAGYFQSSWVPEYARTYLLTHGMNYTYDDLLIIAKGQVALEEEYLQTIQADSTSSSVAPIFLDTNMYVMQVWCEFVFGKCHDWILHQIVKRHYDLYLLCDIDLPWIKDELREYPDLESREQLFHIYRDIMINQSVPFVEINGDYEKRFDTARFAVDELLAAQ